MAKLSTMAVPEALSSELASIKKDALLKRMKIDDDTIMKYVKEHEKSSVIPGVKWKQLLPDEDDDIGDLKKLWREWFDMVKGYVEGPMFGQNFDTPFNFGSRARVSEPQVEPGQTFYDLEVPRTRVVMFKAALSSLFMFVPDKKGFYQEVIEGALDVFDINNHVMTPMTHGGQVYGAASSALRGDEDVTIVLGDDVNIYKKGKQFAFDGANWETQVGTILGAPFHGTKSYFGGMYHVPSGVWDTSLDDTLASLWTLGMTDDLNAGKDIPGIMEREEMDEKVNFMLGLAYAYDSDYPRLQGLKLSQDKAGSQVPLPHGRQLELFAKTPEDQAERWYLGYHGTTPTGGSLLDFLDKIQPEDFKGGEVSELIERGEI